MNTSKSTQVIFPIAILILVTALIRLLYQFDPALTTWYPRCFLHTITGLECPGCGTLRAGHQLLHGNVANAFALNPLMLFLLPSTLVYAGMNGYRKFRNEAAILLPSRVIYLIAIIMTLYMIARNIPLVTITLLAS